MDDICKKFLNDAGIFFDKTEDLNGIVIDRDLLLNNDKYYDMKERIIEFKKIYSSSSLTGLHECADIKQKWPFLNVVRQLLNVHKIEMEPFRKSDGYEKNGKKKYKRYFLLKRIL